MVAWFFEEAFALIGRFLGQFFVKKVDYLGGHDREEMDHHQNDKSSGLLFSFVDFTGVVGQKVIELVNRTSY